MSKPPVITLRTPSSVVIELAAHKPMPNSAVRYSAVLRINNCEIAVIFASTQPKVDALGNLLIMDGSHIILLREFAEPASEFLTATHAYVEGSYE